MPKEETKTKKKGLVRSFFKSFVNVRKWSSYDELSSSVKNVIELFRRFFFHTSEPVYQETYEQSVARLGMNEMQLINRKRVFLYSALTYLVFALVFLVYFMYLLVRAHWFSAFFDLILTAVLSFMFYHEHFWYMQMQKKKLGCNFQDWIAFILRRAK